MFREKNSQNYSINFFFFYKYFGMSLLILVRIDTQIQIIAHIIRGETTEKQIEIFNRNKSVAELLAIF